jgi:hypothetical protein
MPTYTLQTWYYAGIETIDEGPSLAGRDDETTDEQELRVWLDEEGVISPAARDSDIRDVIHQVNNVNGGELVVLIDGVPHGLEQA